MSLAMPSQWFRIDFDRTGKYIGSSAQRVQKKLQQPHTR
jgi:hypothetical protein